MQGDTDLARVGALIGDPGRARVLQALSDGRELPAPGPVTREVARTWQRKERENLDP